MGEDRTSPAPPAPGWLRALRTFAFPVSTLTAVVAAITSVASLWFTHQQNNETYNSAFEQLLQKTIVDSKLANDSQTAAMTLMALHDVALTTRQRETVLLLAARMIHSSDNPSAAAPAARALAIMLSEVRNDGSKLPLVRSRPFFDLVTSGYAASYFEDDPKYPKLMTTVEGDSPITSQPEVALLEQLEGVPPPRVGWIELATFSTRYRYGIAPAPLQWPAPDPHATGGPHVGAQTAAAFVADMAQVERGDLSGACNVRAQYAVAQPAGVPLPSPEPSAAELAATSRPGCVAAPIGAMPPLIGPGSWTSPAPRPNGLLILAPRLLRVAPPIVMVNPDGTFMRGSLGRIIGVVSAGSCVDVVDDDVRPVLVFVEEQYIRGKTPAKADPNHWTGLIHLWAHVAPSHAGCAFPTPQPAG
jgi:hypothetical protein